METVDYDDLKRHETIRVALASEVQRQANSGASRIDYNAMASAVEKALDNQEPPAPSGKRPSELNATNDD